MRNVLNLPVPRVYAWSSHASENPLRAEYILMEKQTGVVLTDVWDTMKGKEKVHILDQVVDIERRLGATKFSKFGSLYYKTDVPDHSDSDSASYLYLDSAGNEVRSETFTIGPTNHRSFFDFRRGELDIDRGPCKFVSNSYEVIPLYLSMHHLRVNDHRIYDSNCTERNRNCKGRSPVPPNARRPFLWTPTIPTQPI